MIGMRAILGASALALVAGCGRTEPAPVRVLGVVSEEQGRRTVTLLATYGVEGAECRQPGGSRGDWEVVVPALLQEAALAGLLEMGLLIDRTERDDTGSSSMIQREAAERRKGAYEDAAEAERHLMQDPAVTQALVTVSIPAPESPLVRTLDHAPDAVWRATVTIKFFGDGPGLEFWDERFDGRSWGGETMLDWGDLDEAVRAELEQLLPLTPDDVRRRVAHCSPVLEPDGVTVTMQRVRKAPLAAEDLTAERPTEVAPSDPAPTTSAWALSLQSKADHLVLLVLFLAVAWIARGALVRRAEVRA